jgi:hypothetical protein
MKKHKRLEVFFEFLIFGIIMGVAEDLLAIVLSTDAPITWNVIWIVVGVTIPFAVLGELIVDRKGPFKKLSKWLVKK